ncbi:MAG: hypothetical protein OXI16_09055 [Chloroflexota bacterium]|nr:hypothetical protein [Chloroflexota bacterium]
MRSTLIQETRIKPYQSSMLKTLNVKSVSATTTNKSSIIGETVVTSISP